MTVLRKPITAPKRPKRERAKLKRQYTTLPTHLLHAIRVEQDHLAIDTATMIRILLSEAVEARRRERMEFQACRSPRSIDRSREPAARPRSSAAR